MGIRTHIALRVGVGRSGFMHLGVGLGFSVEGLGEGHGPIWGCGFRVEAFALGLRV